MLVDGTKSPALHENMHNPLNAKADRTGNLQPRASETIDRTALTPAEIRAMEFDRPRPLFRDPYALLFRTAESVELTRQIAKAMPSLVTTVRLRTRFFDDAIGRALDDGFDQVVILGAGLDTRALRLARPGVTWYEVDSTGILSFKSRCLAFAGHKPGAAHILFDYCQPGLMGALRDAGLDVERNTICLWEGNSQYIPVNLHRKLFNTLFGNIKKLRLAWDYFGSALIDGRSPTVFGNMVLAAARRLGHPLSGWCDDTRRLAEIFGLTVLEDYTMGELAALHAAHDVDLGSDASLEYSVCLMESRAAQR